MTTIRINNLCGIELLMILIQTSIGITKYAGTYRRDRDKKKNKRRIRRQRIGQKNAHASERRPTRDTATTNRWRMRAIIVKWCSDGFQNRRDSPHDRIAEACCFSAHSGNHNRAWWDLDNVSVPEFRRVLARITTQRSEKDIEDRKEHSIYESKLTFPGTFNPINGPI